MNFAFTEEQEELRKTVRQFLESKSSEAAVREQMETEHALRDQAVQTATSYAQDELAQLRATAAALRGEK